MDTVIVTGSLGFIGYSLAKHLLENKYRVIDIHDGEGILEILQNESVIGNFVSSFAARLFSLKSAIINP